MGEEKGVEARQMLHNQVVWRQLLGRSWWKGWRRRAVFELRLLLLTLEDKTGDRTSHYNWRYVQFSVLRSACWIYIYLLYIYRESEVSFESKTFASNNNKQFSLIERQLTALKISGTTLPWFVAGLQRHSRTLKSLKKSLKFNWEVLENSWKPLI